MHRGAWGAAEGGGWVSQADESVATHPLTDEDYRSIADFRAAIRRFLRFSEESARSIGLTPQQHQALLAIRGFHGPDRPAVRDLAEALQLRHHSVVGLVDRLAEAGYVRRMSSPTDNRVVLLAITDHGEEMLDELTGAHIREQERLSAIVRELAGRQQR
ncbi:MAG TPA: MarR family transcriptional regulator [Thermomicrobiales bacterium]|nr:MarR family transcriptional regulator [Thermomicrobiales bacterium]